MNLVALFSEICLQVPDLPAVCRGEQDVSYRELDTLSQHAAQVLRTQGVGPGKVVAIDLPRSIELVVAVLAVLKAGASYMCLDVQTPDMRIEGMLAEQDNPLLIGLPQGRQFACCFLSVDALYLQTSALLTEGDLLPDGGAECACLFYTSGSTGRPKGVRLTHSGVARMALAPDYVRIQPGYHIAGLANPAFDAFNFEVWGALLNGACLSIFEPEDLCSPQAFSRYLQEREIDLLFVTAALFHLMMSEVQDGFAIQRTVLVGGDIMNPSAARTFLKNHPKTQLVNAYGPTECATFAVCHTVPHDFAATTVPIGKPIRDTGWLILDDAGKPVEAGTFGELYLTGAGLAEGYHRLPEETALRFVLPETPEGPVRAYRTGDIVRLNDQEQLELLGRVDNQVKVRGFRIELSEIEHALCTHPSICQACVIMTGEDADKQLVAFIVAKPALMTGWRDWLNERLPVYMIPHRFVPLERLPFNANGKVDRTHLRRLLQAENGELVDASVIEQLCQAVLGGGWNMDQSFIQAGGDSLRAMRLIARLELQGYSLSLRDVLTCPSLEQLEKQLLQGTQRRLAYPALPANPVKSTTPASSEQQRLWLIQTLHPQSRAYHTPFVFSLEGQLDPICLQQALQALSERHQALRTVFVHDNELGVLQQVLPEVTIDLPVVDLAERSSTIDWQRLADSFFLQPFDLQQGPLFRSCLIRLADMRWIWLLDAHHIVLDGQSMNVLLAEISKGYTGARLPVQPYDYGDYCVWQQKFHASEAYRQQLTYWTQWHNEREEYEARTWRADDEHLGRLHTFRLDPVETAALKKLAQARNMTLFSLLCSGLGVVLADFRGAQTVTIATPVENRPLPAFESMIGMFANTLALRLAFDRQQPLGELLDDAHESILLAQAHQDVAFQDVVNAQPERTRHGEVALFDTMFVLENMETDLLALPEVRTRWLPYDSGTAKFPLLLSMTETEEGLQGILEYQYRQVSTQQAEYLSEAYLTLLRHLPTAALTLSLVELPCWHQVRSHRCWQSLKGPQRTLPFDSLGQWFETQAMMTPKKIAIQHGVLSLDYSTLNQRTNKLARYISEKYDLQRGDTVALYSAPSIDAILGVLALTKLGVVALMLDPAYPTAVLSRILSQSPSKAMLHAVELSDDMLLEAWPEDLRLALNDTVYCQSMSGDNLLPVASGEDVLYAVYTSGSTGVPKGCQVRQNTLINLLNWQFETLGLKGSMRTLQFSALTFDVAMQEIHGTLCGGGTLVLIDPAMKQDHVALLQFIAEQHIERIFMPYVALQSLAEVALSLQAPPRGLQEVVTAGEQLYCSEAIRAFFQTSPDAVLINMYGPSETHVVSGYVLNGVPARWPTRPPIGEALDHVTLHVLDEQQRLLPQGMIGEIAVGGLPVWPCYNNNPDANREKFPVLPLSDKPQQVYLTGDLGYVDQQGQLVFVERKDDQVKINGYRIECGHIEAALLATGLVDTAAVMAETGKLVAYVRFVTDVSICRETLLSRLSEQLPVWMLPTDIRLPESFAKTPSGKLDRKALATNPWKSLSPVRCGSEILPDLPAAESRLSPWRDRIALAVQLVLGEKVDENANFFDAGFNSLSLVKLHVRLVQSGADELRLVDLFSHPSVAALAYHLTHQTHETNKEMTAFVMTEPEAENRVAIIGMALNVPGAANLEQFWQNVIDNRECIQVLAPLHDTSPEHVHFVPVCASLEGVFDFCPAYFGISDQEAKMMDPQQRHLLMGAVQALDHAGYSAAMSDPTPMRIGVMVSAGENHYRQKLAQWEGVSTIDPVLMALHQEKDFLATKLSYYLNLQGPSLTVQTACSSSLVAIQQACLNLKAGECDLALAGGVMIDPTGLDGYTYKPGHIFSSDGHCKPFSDQACGTLGGNGFGVVVLKPLAAALRDGDTIYAVVAGCGVNNDGNAKVGYTAPSVNGQAEAIRLSMRRAGVQPSQVGYIEAHGTATVLGDPIEVEALKQAFDLKTEQPFCALASVKSQIGHLGAAAGVVGFIRATLSLYHRVLPPNLGFTSPNPSIVFEASPFYVNSQAKAWQSETLRIAGVSSFGMGGTNCHITLQEAPAVSFPEPKEVGYTLNFTAHSQTALTENILLALCYLQQPECDLSAMARALQRRRIHGKWQASGTFSSRNNALAGLPGLLNRMSLSSGETSVHDVRDLGVLPWDFPPYAFTSAQYAQEGGAATPLKQPMTEWLYEPVWQPTILPAVTTDQRHRCLLLTDTDWSVDLLAASLEQQGLEVITADWMAMPHCVLNQLPLSDGRLTICLALSAVSVERYHRVINWVQAGLRHRPSQQVTFLTLTRQPNASETSNLIKSNDALLHGLVHVLPQEATGWKAACIHWPLNLPEEWPQLAAHIVMSDLEGGLYAWHEAQIQRLNHQQVPFPSLCLPAILQPDVYLVFGGTGGIGRALTERLATLLPGSHFILLSRSCSDISSLLLPGCTVEVLSCDMADEGVMAEVADQLTFRYPSIGGIFHCAGTPGGAMLLWRTKEDAERILAAKVDGCRNLQRYFMPLSPRFVVYASSMSAVFGGVGQCDYSAANAFVNAWATAHDEPTGCRHISISWDVWKSVGMALANDSSEQVAHRQVGLSTEQGLLLLLAALQLGKPHLCISTTPFNQAVRFYGQIPNLATSHQDTASHVPGVSREAIRDVIETQLGIKVNDKSDILYDYGIDSLQTLDLLDALNGRFGSALNLNMLLTTFTVEHIWQLIGELHANSVEMPLRCVREGRSDQTLILIHPIGGDVLAYRELIANMDEGATLYTLQDPRLLGLMRQEWSIGQRAEEYWRLLEVVPKDTKLTLLGWSFGGLVAQEMAAKAERQGRVVQGLVLLDPPAPQTGRDWSEEAGEHLLMAFRRELEVKFGLLENTSTVEGMIDKASRQKTGGQAAAYARLLHDSCASNMRSMIVHQPTALYHTPVLLLQAKQTMPGIEHAGDQLQLNWQQFSSQPLQYVQLDGNHYSILQGEAVVHLATLLKAWLRVL